MSLQNALTLYQAHMACLNGKFGPHVGKASSRDDTEIHVKKKLKKRLLKSLKKAQKRKAVSLVGARESDSPSDRNLGGLDSLQGINREANGATVAELIADMRGSYAKVGGKSPYEDGVPRARTIRMAGKQGKLRALSRQELDVLFPSRKGMHSPAHPGQIFKCLCLEPLGLTVSAAADHLQVTRAALSSFINGRRSITPDLAMRIELLFSSRAALWLGIQAKYDAWQAEAARIELSQVIKPIELISNEKGECVKPAAVKRVKEKSVIKTREKAKALGKKK